MTDAEILEQAKAAALADLELDAPDLPTPVPPASHPPPRSTPTPLPVAAPKSIPLPEVPPSTTTNEADAYDPDFLPQSPSPAIMLDIPQPTLIHILEFLNDWLLESHDEYAERLDRIFTPSTTLVPLAVRRKKGAVVKAKGGGKSGAMIKKVEKRGERPPVPTAHEGAWIMSCLSALSSLLDGDDISTLRTLAKTVLILGASSLRSLERYESMRGEESGGLNGSAEGERERDEEDAEGRARCWMVVAIIAGVWGQTDLWNEVL